MLHEHFNMIFDLENRVIGRLREHAHHVLQVAVHALNTTVTLVLKRQLHLNCLLFLFVGINASVFLSDNVFLSVH